MNKKDASENSHKGHRENVRRRFVVGGLEVFAPHEILELLLFYAIPQKDTNPIAHRLLETYGSLGRVLSAPASELRTIEGVGERTAAFLSLVYQIGRWIRLDDMQKAGVSLLSTQNAVRYLRELFLGQDYEKVYELCLNQKGELVMCYGMSNGSVLSVSMDTRALIQNAIFSRAACVIIAHNHPGGDALPSRDDFEATERIEQAFRNVEIKLYDHIIIGDGDYTSFREVGRITKPT